MSVTLVAWPAQSRCKCRADSSISLDGRCSVNWRKQAGGGLIPEWRAGGQPECDRPAADFPSRQRMLPTGLHNQAASSTSHQEFRLPGWLGCPVCSLHTCLVCSCDSNVSILFEPSLMHSGRLLVLFSISGFQHDIFVLYSGSFSLQLSGFCVPIVVASLLSMSPVSVLYVYVCFSSCPFSLPLDIVLLFMCVLDGPAGSICSYLFLSLFCI